MVTVKAMDGDTLHSDVIIDGQSHILCSWWILGPAQMVKYGEHGGKWQRSQSQQ